MYRVDRIEQPPACASHAVTNLKICLTSSRVLIAFPIGANKITTGEAEYRHFVCNRCNLIDDEAPQLFTRRVLSSSVHSIIVDRQCQISSPNTVIAKKKQKTYKDFVRFPPDEVREARRKQPRLFGSASKRARTIELQIKLMKTVSAGLTRNELIRPSELSARGSIRSTNFRSKVPRRLYPAKQISADITTPRAVIET